MLGLVVGACEDKGDLGSGPGPEGPEGGGALVGTWDVIATENGRPYPLTVTIAANRLEVRTEDGHFLAVLSGADLTVDLRRRSKSSTVIGRRESSSELPLGDIPYSLGGTWSVHGDSPLENCTATIRSGNFDGQCERTFMPSWAPSLSNGSVSVRRRLPLPSRFGELGGTWLLSSTGGTECTISVNDSTVLASCSGDETLEGSFDLEIDADIATGSTSRGLEIAAQRRVE
jgi:hypothetical protein